jgi:hypothetical protein
LMWHQMCTSFLNTLRSASFQGEPILQPSSVMQIAWTPHTHIRPHVTSSNYIVLQPIALRFHNKTTRMNERDQRNVDAQLQFWSRGNKSIYSLYATRPVLAHTKVTAITNGTVAN